MSTINPSVPIEQACPLVAEKLREPDRVLDEEASIDLIRTGIAYGLVSAQAARGRDIVIVIGNTGAGKSTTVNFLAGCTMELRELDGQLGDVVVVRPVSEGGALDALMPIGHSLTSTTFIPDIRTCPADITYCDCPGFLDNRGAEINIVNAVNIRTALSLARSVRVMILVNYHSLEADRGRGLADLCDMCTQLFGSVQDLQRHRHSVFVAVSRYPAHVRDFLIRVRKFFEAPDAPAAVRALADRLCLLHPIDSLRTADAWDRAEFLRRVDELPRIEDTGRVFHTVLVASDEVRLLQLSHAMDKRVAESLSRADFASAASWFAHLRTLLVIRHRVIDGLVREQESRVVRALRDLVSAAKVSAREERFAQYDEQLEALRLAMECFSSCVANMSEKLEMTSLYEVAAVCRYQSSLRAKLVAHWEHRLAESNRSHEVQLQAMAERERQLSDRVAEMRLMYESLQRDVEALRSSTAADREAHREALQQELSSLVARHEAEKTCLLALNQTERAREAEAEAARVRSLYAARLAADEQSRAAEAAKAEERLQAAARDAQERMRTLEAERDALAKEKARVQAEKQAQAREAEQTIGMLRQQAPETSSSAIAQVCDHYDDDVPLC